MRKSYTPFQLQRTKLSDCLTDVCTQLDWQRDAESFIRCQATAYETSLESGTFENLPSRITVLTMDDPEGEKILTTCDIDFGKNQTANIQALYTAGNDFINTVRALPLLLFIQSEALKTVSSPIKPRHKPQPTTMPERKLLFLSATAFDGRHIGAQLEIESASDNRFSTKGEFEFLTNVVDRGIPVKDYLSTAFFNGWLDAGTRQLMSENTQIEPNFTINMPPAVRQGLLNQKERFREKFGREPGPEDPIFFDPNSDSTQPRPLSDDDFLKLALSAARHAGIPEERARQFFKGIDFAKINKLPGQ